MSNFSNYNNSNHTENMNAYETRQFIPDRDYPPMAHDHDHLDHIEQHDQPRYPSPPPPLSENPYNAQPVVATPDNRMEMPELPKDESDAPSPGRSKPVPKPDREVTKD